MIPWVAENLGRRGGLLVNNVLTVIGCFLCYMSLNWPYYTIMVGRFLLGVSMICGVGLASLFLIEVAPLECRGSSGSLIQIFRGFGGTLGMVLTLPDLLGTPSSWTLALALPAFPAIIQFSILFFCMESPRHIFITENNPTKASKAVKFYQGSARVPSAMIDLKSEKQKIDQQQQTKWVTILTSGEFWRPLLLTALALTNRSLAGILLVQSYSTDMFIAAGLEHRTAAYNTVVLGVCHLISAIIVTFTVEKFGRRNMLIYGNVGCLISLCFVAAFSSLATKNSLFSYLTVCFMAVFMLIYPVVASVSNIVASEICHQKIRSFAFTVGLLCYSVVGFISTFAYPLLKNSMGVGWSYTPFILCLILTVAVYIRWLPETKGKTFEMLAFSKNSSGQDDQKPLLTTCFFDEKDTEPLLSSNGHISDSVEAVQYQREKEETGEMLLNSQKNFLNPKDDLFQLKSDESDSGISDSAKRVEDTVEA